MFCDHKKSYLDLKFISDKKKKHWYTKFNSTIRSLFQNNGMTLQWIETGSNKQVALEVGNLDNATEVKEKLIIGIYR